MRRALRGGTAISSPVQAPLLWKSSGRAMARQRRSGLENR
jgi:hypothetical protein